MPLTPNLDSWPALPYHQWRDTRDTLHMYTQVVGKLRLALSPFEPEWANVPFYVTARGLSTSTIPVQLHTVDAEFDLLDHALVLRRSDGAIERRPLGGSVADFYADVMAALRRLGVDVDIAVTPSEVSDPIPFPDDRTHDTYEPDHATRFFRALSAVDILLKEHHARFRGRTTPVQFFWGTFDLAVTRYSGRPAPPPEHRGIIARFSGDAELICAGWWPGDEQRPEPALFSYAYPKPDGISEARVRPETAGWNAAAGEFLLPYDAVRTAAGPHAAVRAFLESTYDAAASLMGWDPELVHVVTPAMVRS